MQQERRQRKQRSLAERVALNQKILENDGERRNWLERTQEVIRYVRLDLAEELEGTRTRGEKRGQYTYTSKPLTDAEKAADGFVGNVFQESGWFAPVMALSELNDYDLVQGYLQRCERHLMDVYRDSGFVSMLQPPVALDGLTLGDGLVYCGSEESDDLPYYEHCRMLNAYLKRDRFGRLKVVHYLRPYMACEAYERWGDKLSETTQQLAYSDPYKAVVIIQTVYHHNDLILQDLPDLSRLPIERNWIEVLIERDSPKNYPALTGSKDPLAGVLDQQGYHTNPFSDWPYWLNDPSESYGRSPYGSAIISIKRLHSDHKTMMNASQRAASGPLQGPKELKDRIDLRPDAYNPLEGSAAEGIRQIYTKIDYPYGAEYLERLEGQLEDVLHLPLYQAMTMATKEMTVPEVLERIGERARILAPRLGSYQHLYLNPLHDRTWQIEAVAKRLPPPPPELAALVRRFPKYGKIRMRYKGPLSEAGEMLFLQRRIAMTMGMLEGFVALDPDAVRDQIRIGTAVEHVLDQSNWPQDAIATEEEVQAKQQLRNQLALQEAAARIGETQTKAVRNMASSEATLQETAA